MNRDPSRYGPGRYGDFRDDMLWIHDPSFSVGEHRCLITAVTSFTIVNMSVQQRDAVGAHMNALRNALFHSLPPHHLQAQRQAVFLEILSDFSYKAHSIFLRKGPVGGRNTKSRFFPALTDNQQIIKVLARAHHRAHASDLLASRNGPHREDFESCTSQDTVKSRPVSLTADYIDTSDHGNRSNIEDLDSTVAQETHASRAPSPTFTTPVRGSPTGDSNTALALDSDYGNNPRCEEFEPTLSQKNAVLVGPTWDPELGPGKVLSFLDMLRNASQQYGLTMEQRMIRKSIPGPEAPASNDRVVRISPIISYKFLTILLTYWNPSSTNILISVHLKSTTATKHLSTATAPSHNENSLS
ncbi:hypothetical protein IWZ01DRAFT_480472 [Phyllosticta capitalensis]